MTKAKIIIFYIISAIIFVFYGRFSYELGVKNGIENGTSVGYEDGYETGCSDGYKKGMNIKFQQETEASFQEGYEQGVKNGTETGFNDGFKQGVQKGKQEAKIVTITEIPDGYIKLTECIPLQDISCTWTNEYDYLCVEIGDYGKQLDNPSNATYESILADIPNVTEEYRNNMVNMSEVVDYDATESGLYLYMEDGDEYYWEAK